MLREVLLTALVQVVFTVAAALVMDRLGRRILLLVSALFMTVSISLLGMYFYFAKHEPDVAQSMAILPVVSLSVFVAMFSIGFGPIPWLMMSELFSPEVKSTSCTILCFTVLYCAVLYCTVLYR